MRVNVIQMMMTVMMKGLSSTFSHCPTNIKLSIPMFCVMHAWAIGVIVDRHMCKLKYRRLPARFGVMKIPIAIYAQFVVGAYCGRPPTH